jgi:hypothetical protein
VTAPSPSARTAAGARKRLRSTGQGITSDMLARTAENVARLACADGRHRTETDVETGDEVCRFCGQAVTP